MFCIRKTKKSSIASWRDGHYAIFFFFIKHAVVRWCSSTITMSISLCTWQLRQNQSSSAVNMLTYAEQKKKNKTKYIAREGPICRFVDGKLIYERYKTLCTCRWTQKGLIHCYVMSHTHREQPTNTNGPLIPSLYISSFSSLCCFFSYSLAVAPLSRVCFVL